MHKVYRRIAFNLIALEKSDKEAGIFTRKKRELYNAMLDELEHHFSIDPHTYTDVRIEWNKANAR